MKQTMSQPIRKLIMFCLPIGSLLLVISVFLFIRGAEIKNEGVLCQAKIIDIRENGDSHSVTVQYEVDGVTYKKRMSEYSSTWDIGDMVDIYYDPSNPNEMHTKTKFFLLPLIIAGTGLILFLIGIITVGKNRNRVEKQKRLMVEGRKVYATIKEINVDETLTVYGVHPYYVNASYMDEYSGVIYDFKSHKLWEEPLFNVGQIVLVYMNPKNPQEYYMDIESLEKGLVQ